MSKKVAFHTLGCRLNMAETGSVAQGFAERGYKIVDFGEEADVVFLNTCTVTDRADSTCRNLIRKAKKSSPEGKVVVAGCYAQMEAEAIAAMKGVDLILGTSEKYKVFDYLEDDERNEEQLIRVEKSNQFWGASTTPADSHTRAFLKIQDGCNYVCSFCIIPFARGRSRAITIPAALDEARRLVSQGFKEIVLTGVNIGEFESSNGEKLETLLQELLQVENLQRLRLSSVEPNTITDDLLKVLKSSPKFLDHFHIPLQSGSPAILASMRRKYTADNYRQIIQKVKTAFPGAGIGADIIVGYPGEGEKEFAETYSLLEELPLTHFHVFPFSRRKGTTAARHPDQIPYGVKKERVRLLMELGKKKLDQFARGMEGKVLSVLFEQGKEGEGRAGFTGNYLRVKVEGGLESGSLANEIRPVLIKEGRGEMSSGEVFLP